MKLILHIFMLFVITSNAQTSEMWHVIDSASESSLPFALIIDATSRHGMLTDDGGYFNISNADSSHLFLATSIGYDTVRFKIHSIQSRTIRLSTQPILRDTVTILATDPTCLRSLGYPKKKRHHTGTFNFKMGSEVAVFIPNDSRGSGRIQTIRFHVGRSGFPTSKFRALLYNLDSANGSPSTLLVNKDIILCAKEGGEWVEADIRYLNIEIPKNGFFVSMEWLPDAKQYLLLNNGDSSRVLASGQALDVGTAVPTCITWTRDIDNEWIKVSSLIGGDIAFQNAMIAADVLIFCDDSNSK